MAPAALHLIHGEESLLVDEAAARWLTEARSAAADVEIVAGSADLGSLRQSLAEVPLFDPEHYILLRNPVQLSAKRSATELLQALELQAPTTYLCITVYSTLAASNPVLERAKKLGKVEHFPQLRGRELRNWLGQEVHRRGLRLPPGGADHLLRTTSSAAELGHELDKLAAFAPPQLSLQMLQQLCGASEQLEVWSVLERMLGEKPGSGAYAMLDLLQRGRASQLILSVLAGQIREIVLAQALRDRGISSAPGIAKEMKIAGWRAERLLRHSRRIPPSVAQDWLRQLQRIDADTKQGNVIDSDALTAFALRAAAAVQAK